MTRKKEKAAEAETAKAEDVKQPSPPAVKVLRAVIYTGDDVNQNEFKDWVKACPFSEPGGQIVGWARKDNGQLFCKVKITVLETLPQDEFDGWLAQCPLAPAHKVYSMPDPNDDEAGYYLAPEPSPESAKE